MSGLVPEQPAGRTGRVAVDSVKISGSKLVMDAHRRLMRRLLRQRDFGFGALLLVIDFFVRHFRGLGQAVDVWPEKR